MFTSATVRRLIALALAPCLAFAGNLTGTIVDQSDTAVNDAQVQIVELRRTTSVNSEGQFSFQNVSNGVWTLVVNSSEFGSKLFTVEINNDQDRDVRLTVDLTIHEDLVVSTTAEAKSISDVAQAVGVLSKEDLMEKVEPSLGETLALEPGVSSTYFGPGSSRPIIRGLGGDRVRILEGGLASGDVSNVSADHAVSIDPVTVERIEILRGPAALRYGPSAVGGAVNVIDNRIPEYLSDDNLHGTFDARLGTAAEERSFAIDLNGSKGRVAWHVDMSSLDTDDVEIPGFSNIEDGHDDDHDDDHGDDHGDDDHGDDHGDDDDDDHDDDHDDEEPVEGILENSSMENRKAAVGVSYITDKGFFGVAVSGMDNNYGVPGHSHGHGHDDDHDDDHGDDHEDDHGKNEDDDDDHGHGDEEAPVRIDLKQRRIDLRGERRFENSIFNTLNLRLGTADYEHQELEGDEIGTLFTNEYYEFRGELTHDELGIFTNGSIGVQFSDRDFSAVGAEAFVPPNQTQQFGVYFYEEYQQPKWSLTFGGRYENQSNEGTVLHHDEHDDDHHDDHEDDHLFAKDEHDDHEDDHHDEEEPEFVDLSFSGLSTAIGLVLGRDSQYGAAFNLTHTSRAPTAEELFSNGPHLATSSFEIGSIELQEETSTGLDATFRKKGDRFRGEVSLFINKFDDFIYQEAHDEIEDGLPVYEYTQEDAEFRGGEVHLDVTLLHTEPHHLHAEFTYDTVRAELDSGGYLPRITPDRLTFALEYQRPSFHAKIMAQRVSEQDRVAVNETHTDAYTMLNANIGYHFFSGAVVHKLLLRGTNLSDEEARSHTSFLKNQVLLPGRNISLTWRMMF